VTSPINDRLQSTLGAAYTLQHELGGGGMSRVWLARENALGRDVVVKLLHPELAGGVNVDRFKREIQLAAQLQHPHIVPILSAGEMDGLPYLTMPFVAGRSLRERLSESPPLSMDETVSILRDVARALAYAHGRGIIHRDIKPDNVLLAEGSATVTDFGVAKAVNAARSAPGSTITSIGTSIGTPAYMAPEQCAGDPNTDHRADIYAWGIMAYEMLAGRLPFLYKAPHELLAAQISEVPKPIETLQPDTPAALAQVVMQCLEKSPDARPQSAAILVQALAASGGHDTRPAIGLATRRSLGKALAIYAAALVAVLIVGRAAMITFGWPDWAFTGMIVLMLLGLPVILFTAWAHHGSRMARTMATLTPGGSVGAPHSTMTRLAVKVSPHVSWRRTAIGGIAALIVFVALVSGFMVARANGIGPFGSLMGRKVLGAQDLVLVTDFNAPTSDSSLGTVVSEAVRTNLGQSRAVTVMQTSAVAAALTRMQRPATARVDLAVGRELAEREGAKAIIDGTITPLGASYVVTARIIATHNGDVIASFNETAKDATDMIPAIDRVTRAMREKIGESLKSVRATAPLMQATTTSLPALRKYTEAFRANAVEQHYLAAAKAFEEAIHLDTNFALAYRGASLAYSNARVRPTRSESLRVRAFELRDRLPDLERALVEGAYYNAGAHADRAKAIAAYTTALEFDSRNASAVNSLGLLLASRRDFAKADSVYRLRLQTGQASAFIYTNLIPTLINEGKVDQSGRVYDEFLARFPKNPGAAVQQWPVLAARGKLDSVVVLCRQIATGADPQLRALGNGCLGELAQVAGRIREAERFFAVQNVADSARGATLSLAGLSRDSAFDDIWFRGNAEQGVKRLDAQLIKDRAAGRYPSAGVPLQIIGSYTEAGRVDRARAALGDYDAKVVADTARQRLNSMDRHYALGDIALVEKQYDVAIREFQLADTLYDGAPTPCPICVLPSLGRAYDLAGKHADAVRTFETYLTTPYAFRLSSGIDAQYLAGVYKRLGELYEEKGDAAKAMTCYGKFIELWKNADPELQPKVTEIKQRLARLQAKEKR
jgi:tetratricopeptide (TPR) repeat protein/TolB-like protein